MLKEFISLFIKETGKRYLLTCKEEEMLHQQHESYRSEPPEDKLS